MEAIEKESLLTAHRICRNFETSDGTLEVLKEVDLDIKKREMIAIVGESGVGKSTLLHILGGLDRPTGGQLSVMGVTFADKNESQLAQFRNRNVGFIFQHHYLMEDFTALENTMMPALIMGQSKETAVKLAEQLLSDVGLNKRMNHRPKQLSGGEQQRVAVARAMANGPGIVIADEPSGNLDIKTGEKLHRLLENLNKTRGVTFVIATHNVDLAKSCRRVVKLENGRLTPVD